MVEGYNYEIKGDTRMFFSPYFLRWIPKVRDQLNVKINKQIR